MSNNLSSVLLFLSVVVGSSQPLFATEPPSTEEWLLISAAAADIATTEWGLSRGATEMNPFLQSPQSRIAAKTAATGLIILGARTLETKGHPTAAKWIRRAGIGVWFGAAGWNISVSFSK